MQVFFSEYKKDIIVLAILIMVGIIGFASLNFVKKQGNLVEVRVDGNIELKLPISASGTYEIEGYKGGKNVVRIENGMAQMLEADCPDGLCVNMGNISNAGQTIICLPHRVVVEIKEGTDEGF